MKRQASVTLRGHRTRIAVCAVALLAFVPAALAQKAQAPAPTAPTKTLDRIRQTGQIRLGYRTDAAPFSYKENSGLAAGYSVALCTNVVDAIKADLALATLGVEWVPVTLTDWSSALQQGQIDLLCSATSETLTRRKDVDFSIPIFPSGVGALLRSDAPLRLREILSGQQPSGPQWRASAYEMLQTQTFAVVKGTTAEPWLAEKMSEFQLSAKIAPVATYKAGVQAVLERNANVLFGDRAILWDAAAHDPRGKLAVLDRFFTYELVALSLRQDDDAFRFVVDRALSRFYGTADFVALFTKWFGKPNEKVLAFFRWNTLPE
jgi:ABC-type amino acid transport substrate-binding protein